jgi:hypothetical protein
MLNLIAAATCVIVYSGGTDGNWQEKRDHEIAHCNGWEHPEKADPTGRAYQPPKRFIHTYAGKIVEQHVSLAEAKQLCDGHYACQRFE